MNWKNILRTLGAVAALVAGGTHLWLYFDRYKDAPGSIGTQFVFNAIGAAAIAAGLLAPLVSDRFPSWIPKWASSGGILWAVISLVAFVVARTDTGWFGFQDEGGLNPSPGAQLSVFPEILVLVAATLLRGIPLFTGSDDD